MAEPEYVQVVSYDKARTFAMPLRAECRPSGDYFANMHDEVDMLGMYDPLGALTSVIDTLVGKTIYPPKAEAERWIGRYDASKVYFIQAETGQIKIGVAESPATRLCTLQVGSPVKLALICVCDGGQPQERDYHRRFAEHRLHGEWFLPHPAILAEIERLKA